MMAQVNSKYDLAYILGIDGNVIDHLTEEADNALDDLFEAMAVFDCSDCHWYWRDLTEDEEVALLEMYVPMMCDEDGNWLVWDDDEN